MALSVPEVRTYDNGSPAHPGHCPSNSARTVPSLVSGSSSWIRSDTPRSSLTPERGIARSGAVGTRGARRDHSGMAATDTHIAVSYTSDPRLAWRLFRVGSPVRFWTSFGM